jgi:hypothetical protein
MRFWNIDLDDWISRRRFDESVLASHLAPVVYTISIVGMMNFRILGYH